MEGAALSLPPSGESYPEEGRGKETPAQWELWADVPRP